ncbi:DUF4258 domain-containing protein [Candidatus Falkowbacteria bacterium]|nr:DUF4258 domain-containing protein [Candidatus Falkowbacteria bacterium]
MSNVKFSRHARQRLSRRSNLPLEDVEDIIRYNLCVIVGFEQIKKFSSRKIHKLFWSIPDENWFVIIQDELTGVVITILPPRRSCWVITYSSMEKAKQLVLGKELPQ